MTDHYNDYMSEDEVSTCCGASIIGLDNGMGHCSECKDWTTPAELSDYERRVEELEAEGLTRSDAQGVADVEVMRGLL